MSEPIAIEHMENALRALKSARTSLHNALTTRGLPDSAASWDVHECVEAQIIRVARRLHIARLERLKGRAA